MVFNATFNNISAISWRSALLVEETGVHEDTHRPVASHWQLYHIIFVDYTSQINAIQDHNLNMSY
jgi:hypothetical protein